MTSRETIYHCAGPECISSAQSMESPPIRGWIEVKHGTDGSIRDFCSWDCVLKFAATFDAVEVLP